MTMLDLSRIYIQFWYRPKPESNSFGQAHWEPWKKQIGASDPFALASILERYMDEVAQPGSYITVIFREDHQDGAVLLKDSAPAEGIGLTFLELVNRLVEKYDQKEADHAD